MPQPGAVFIWKNFVFNDGSTRDKYFVVLCSPNSDDECLALKTTSVPRRYSGCIKGCNKGRYCFYVPFPNEACFKSDTFIQLPQIEEFSAASLIQASLSAQIELKDPLSASCFSQLKSCLALFKTDIPEKHWSMIYK